MTTSETVPKNYNNGTTARVGFLACSIPFGKKVSRGFFIWPIINRADAGISLANLEFRRMHLFPFCAFSYRAYLHCMPSSGAPIFIFMENTLAKMNINSMPSPTMHIFIQRLLLLCLFAFSKHSPKALQEIGKHRYKMPH
jgi:hypothetical protein